jgi:heptosyltransferase-2
MSSREPRGIAALRSSGGAIPRGEPRRIVYLRTDRLGETLLNLPAIAALKAARPEAQVTLVAQPELAELLEDDPLFDAVIPYRGGVRAAWWLRAIRLAATLRRCAFDAAVVSNPKQELHLAVWLAGIPMRVGYGRKGGRWWLTHRLEDRKALGDRHEVEYNLDLVRALGFSVGAPQWVPPRFDRERAEVLQLLERQGVRVVDRFVVIHPWSSNPVKQWPPDRYRRLIQDVAERLKIPVVIIGGTEEIARAAAVLPQAEGVVNLTGRVSLRQLAGLLKSAALLVSSDSGPVHLAAAFRTRTVVLFGAPTPATGPTRWGPWGEGHVVIWKPSMVEITVDEVVQALERQLA